MPNFCRPLLFVLCGLVTRASLHAEAIYQPYAFRTLAGVAPGNVDGPAAAARFRTIASMASDSAGNIYMADQVSSTIRKMTPDGTVTTIAGLAGYTGTADGIGNAARFKNPRGVAVDSSGIVYVADTGNHTIRKITPDRSVSTIAGNPGTTGTQDGTGIIGRFNQPQGIACASSGTIFVADTGNFAIRAVTPAGVVTTFSGLSGTQGTQDGTGTGARFAGPAGITADAAGNLFVTEPLTSIVRKITPGRVVITFAGLLSKPGNVDGSGSNARFSGPTGIAIDSAGNLFVTDVNNLSVREITPAANVTTLAPAGPFASVFGIAVANNRVFVADPTNGAIFAVDSSGNVALFAGVPSAGNVDGVGSQAKFWRPSAVALDSSGNLFVADTNNNAVRKVTPDGQVTTFASGSAFNSPQGIAVDSAGNVYVAQTGANTISKITPDGTVSTLAGSGAFGSADGKGTAASFGGPIGLAVDAAGNVFVADTQNDTIRKITAAGVVTTFAGVAASRGSADGTGGSAQFYFPSGVAIDASGNIYVADTTNETIRKITPGAVVTTIAGTPLIPGSADGAGNKATFTYPVGVAADKAGNVFVVEQFGETIRRIAPDRSVTTIGGAGGIGGSTDGAGSLALFYQPFGIAVDNAGRIYVADSNNDTIRVSSAGPVSQLLNISTRGVVQTGDNLLIGGVIAAGSSNKNVVLRAIGPSLANSGVQGALADPVLELHDNTGQIVASNDNWKTNAGNGQSQETAIRATGIAPSSDAESALLATLSAFQNYTVVVRGQNGTTGVALVEAYDLNPTAGSVLGNISTRGVVQTNTSVLIGGVIVGGQSGSAKVLVRAIGPSLSAAGVPNALADPLLDLRDANGNQVAANDNWKDSNAAAIQATGIPPTDDRESAIVTTLPPGAYTAVVSGKSGGTGVGLVELYNVP